MCFCAFDDRALSNAGLWCVRRLQADADRERVIDGLCGPGDAGSSKVELTRILRQLDLGVEVVLGDALQGAAVLVLEA